MLFIVFVVLVVCLIVIYFNCWCKTHFKEVKKVRPYTGFHTDFDTASVFDLKWNTGELDCDLYLLNNKRAEEEWLVLFGDIDTESVKACIHKVLGDEWEERGRLDGVTIYM